MLWLPILYILAAYLVGSVPTGYIIAKQLKGIDIREHGSGNVGATNVKRVVGNKAGLACLILDFLKGAIPVLGANLLFTAELDPNRLVPALTVLATVIGHSKSVYLKFTGGKAAITSLGALIALQPLPALIAGIIGSTTVKVTRYVSVGSMAGAIAMPIAFYFCGAAPAHVGLALLVAIYVIVLHRSNIRRLLAHQENRL